MFWWIEILNYIPDKLSFQKYLTMSVCFPYLKYLCLHLALSHSSVLLFRIYNNIPFTFRSVIYLKWILCIQGKKGINIHIWKNMDIQLIQNNCFFIAFMCMFVLVEILFYSIPVFACFWQYSLLYCLNYLTSYKF